MNNKEISRLDDPIGAISQDATSKIDKLTGGRARFHYVVNYRRKILGFNAGIRTETHPDDGLMKIVTGYVGIEHIEEGEVVKKIYNPRTGKHVSFIHKHNGSWTVDPNIPCTKSPLL